MCTLVILRRPGQSWPLILAANRDEMSDRPWRPPARHWPDRPDVVAGLDEIAGGTWLGLNDAGVVAAVMNREGALGPAAGKRSRGELVLEALDHADAVDAAESLGHLDPDAYRAFNLVIADNRDAFWLRSEDGCPVETTPIGDGLSMLTARDMNDRSVPRIRAFLSRFERAEVPDPGRGAWQTWESLMAAGPADPDNPRSAMSMAEKDGYGTLSGSLIALPADPVTERPVWRFTEGPPGTAPFEDVRL